MDKNKAISFLTFKRPMFPSDKNQSANSQSNSTDWFLCDRNIGHEKVNSTSIITLTVKFNVYDVELPSLNLIRDH